MVGNHATSRLVAHPVADLVSDECCASVLGAPLDEAAAADLAHAFAALADPVRLRLLSLIADAGEVCSCDLLRPLTRDQHGFLDYVGLISIPAQRAPVCNCPCALDSLAPKRNYFLCSRLLGVRKEPKTYCSADDGGQQQSC